MKQESQQEQIIIPLKLGQVCFKDIIRLDNEQLAIIREVSIQRTQQEWIHKDTPGIDVLLTPEQKQSVVEFKQQIVEGMSAEELLDEDLVRVTNHALKRLNYRLENQDPDELLNEEQLLKLAQAIIDSVEVKGAQWKGRQNLSYKFLSSYDGKSIEMSLVFTDAVVIITIILPDNGPSGEYGFSISDIVASKLKKSSLFDK